MKEGLHGIFRVLMNMHEPSQRRHAIGQNGGVVTLGPEAP